MTTYALITRALVDTGSRKRNIVPIPPEQLSLNKPYWVPVVEEITDTSTGSNIVRTPWVETVEIARILRSRTIRDKTPVELDAEDASNIDSMMAFDGLERAMARALLTVINDVRKLQKPVEQPLSVPEFKTYLRGLMR